VPYLKTLCELRGLSNNGTKAELVEQLQVYDQVRRSRQEQPAVTKDQSTDIEQSD